LAELDTDRFPAANTPSPPRVVERDTGTVMVVTDLHGDLALYRRYRDVFLALQDRGLTQTLVFTGDLIHGQGLGIPDGSLEIILDLIELEAELGDALVVLLGNHEMPHIYHVPISKGKTVYTPDFEAAMGEHREAILDFLRRRPFFVRTAAGVTLCHAGAFPEAGDPEAMNGLTTFSHVTALNEIKAAMGTSDRTLMYHAVAASTTLSYRELSQLFCAADDPEDPRYDDYLIGVLAGIRHDFRSLWSALFSRNEHEAGMRTYTRQVRELLAYLSTEAMPQRVVVTGHIGCRNGYRAIAGGLHLRVASGAHAHPYASGRYLLFDAAAPITEARDLVTGLGSVFEDGA